VAKQFNKYPISVRWDWSQENTEEPSSEVLIQALPQFHVTRDLGPKTPILSEELRQSGPHAGAISFDDFEKMAGKLRPSDPRY